MSNNKSNNPNKTRVRVGRCLVFYICNRVESTNLTEVLTGRCGSYSNMQVGTGRALFYCHQTRVCVST